MKALETVRNYCFYCGIEKDEYDSLKKDAYVSNFAVWRILHFAMVAVFGALFISSLLSDLMQTNKPFYLGGFLYSIVATWFFFILKKDSIAAQLLIYLSISVLFLFGGFISQNRPGSPAATFIVMLLITPMFMIDKPYFMGIELGAASAVFLVWMHAVKPYEVWQMDFVNVIVYMVVGIFLHIVANSIRIKEFVLTRKLNIQKDLDGLTGLKNKDALTREINACLADDSMNKGLLFIMDVDRFKAINDTYGHDVGDSVIHQIGAFLGGRSAEGEIVGRFGGDEFILFIPGADNRDTARRIAGEIVTGAAETVALPTQGERISVSIGVAIYHGLEKNYSEVFKKADTALYRAKADPAESFSIYGV